MREVGIDLSHGRPRKLTAELAQNAEMLITMGCGDECPYVPGLRRDDWPLQIPRDKESSRCGRPATKSATCFAVAGAGTIEQKRRYGVAILLMQWIAQVG